MSTQSAHTRSSASSLPFYSDKMNLVVYIDEQGEHHPIHSVAGWQNRRAHIVSNMEQVMGELPEASRRVPLDVEVAEGSSQPKYVRKKITFAAEPGDRVPAYLLIPNAVKDPAPAMLCLHQTITIGKGEPAGLGGSVNLRYAHELAARGYVCLAPDYPRFGDYTVDAYALGYISATMKGIWNHIRAVDLLQALPEVNGDRIGAIGHSLGGHNSLYVAIFDERIKVVVTSCGFNSFFKYYGGDLTGWSHPGYMPRIASVYDKNPGKMPFDFTEVLGALAPRHVFINAPLHDGNFEVSGVRDCVEAATPVYELYHSADNLVAVHPDCGHDFPPEVRDATYEFIGKVLNY